MALVGPASFLPAVCFAMGCPSINSPYFIAPCMNSFVDLINLRCVDLLTFVCWCINFDFSQLLNYISSYLSIGVFCVILICFKILKLCFRVLEKNEDFFYHSEFIDNVNFEWKLRIYEMLFWWKLNNPLVFGIVSYTRSLLAFDEIQVFPKISL